MVHRNVLYTLALTRSRSTVFKELQSFSYHLITYIFFDGAKFKQLEKNIFEQILITSVLRKTSRVQVQSNVAIRNFLVALKLFLNTKSSLWSKGQIGHRKWFLHTNLFLIKPFLIAKFDCLYISVLTIDKKKFTWDSKPVNFVN